MYKKCRNLLQKSMVQQTNYGKLLASKLCFSHFRQFYTMRCQDHTPRIKNYTSRLKNTTEIKKKHKMFNLRKIYVNRMFWSLLRYWQESDFFWAQEWTTLYCTAFRITEYPLSENNNSHDSNDGRSSNCT